MDDQEADGVQELQASSITYRIALGAWRGRKVFTLQTLPSKPTGIQASNKQLVSKQSGFSLHAGVASKPHQRDKLERLCRYIARPAVSTERLSLTASGKVRYELKTPYRDGTTHVIFDPLDFMARLAALVPKPRVNLTRFHGVFSPNSKLRAQVTNGHAQKQTGKAAASNTTGTDEERRSAMTWARRLKCVFEIDVTICPDCQGPIKDCCLHRRQAAH